MADLERPRKRATGKLTPMENLVVVLAMVTFVLPIGYLGLFPGILISVPLALGVIAIPVVVAVRRQNSDDRARRRWSQG